MRFQNLLIAFIVTFSFASCTPEGNILPINGSIIGTWETISEKSEVFDKSGKLIDSEINAHSNANEKDTYTFTADKTGTQRYWDDNKWTTSKLPILLKEISLICIILMSQLQLLWI